MSDLLETFEKIPKGINIIVFIWAMIGLLLLFRDPRFRKGTGFYVFLAMIGFMSAWRILFRIATSRYASGLILPCVVLASYFLYNSGKRRHGLVRLVLYGAIACSWFILLKMNVDSMTRNESGYVIAEVFRGIDATRGSYEFRAPWKDYGRIYYASHLGDKIRAVNKKDVAPYVFNFSDVYADAVLNVESRTIVDDDRLMYELKNNQTQLVSLVEEDKMDKKQLVFLLSSGNSCVPVPEHRVPPYRPNLLDNGDLELADTPEESRAKINAHLAGHAVPGDADDPVLTPRNAFFSAGAGMTSRLEFGTSADSPIDGNRSAWIRVTPEKERDSYDFEPYSMDGTAFLMFDQKFTDGKYEYSVLVKGKTGTEICLFREFPGDGGGARPVRIATATFTIPDRRLFRITAHFTVDGLNGDGFFRVGVSVRDGEAFFDDFSLTRTSGASKAN